MAKPTVETIAQSDGVKKIIVAVHGIGDQTSYATAQSTLFQFCNFLAAPPAVPLGEFYTGEPPLRLPVPPFPEAFNRLAFAEAYWANIPRDNAETYTLEEARKWAKTIVERVRQRNQLAKPQEQSDSQTVSSAQVDRRNSPDAAIAEEGLSGLEQVLTEMLQALGVLDRLCYLADKAGVFTFDLNKVLVDYLGDVQVVTEFQTLRSKILAAFDEVMTTVYKAHKGAEIYIVAHSEGTVVSLLGLLEAMCCPTTPAWVKNVRGFMTIGSPIDKHLILWPELFNSYRVPRWEPDSPIEWRNYYDTGDPVGFRLNTMREWLNGEWSDFTHRWRAFNFKDEFDYGFTRYPFPGKAHTEYWNDDAVFGHFIQTVVGETPPAPAGKRKPDYSQPPRNRTVKKYLSYVLPYLGISVLLYLAVFVLYKAISAYVDPEPESKQPALLIFKNVGSYTLLLAGLTLFARIPRLKQDWGWRSIGIGSCLFSAICFHLIRGDGYDWVILLAMGVVGFLAPVYFKKRFKSPGTRTLLCLGGAAVAAVSVYHLQKGDDPGPLWPVVLAGLSFLYLWWLVILLFDLTFIWHSYIHNSAAMSYLRNLGRTSPESKKRDSAVPGGYRLETMPPTPGARG